MPVAAAKWRRCLVSPQSRPRRRRRRHRPYQREIQALEKRVGLHVSRPALGPEPLRRVLDKQRGDEIPRVHFTHARRGFVGESQGLLHYAPQRILIGCTRKWGPPVHHLVDEHPERPPIDGIPVGLPGGHLRRHVLVGPDERARPGRHRLRHEQPAVGERLNLFRPKQPAGNTRKRKVNSPNIAAADLADQAEIPEAQAPLVAKRVKRRIRRAVGLKRRRVLLRRARGEIKRQAAKASAVTVIATTHRTLTGIHALRNINLVGTTINNQMPKIREFKKNVWNKGMMNSEKGD
nr:hypothetical protein Pyn_01577 [Ipomoea batatas]